MAFKQLVDNSRFTYFNIKAFLTWDESVSRKSIRIQQEHEMEKPITEGTERQFILRLPQVSINVKFTPNVAETKSKTMYFSEFPAN